ncbi:MAG TPA: AAA domain-containing protein, partial [Polyangiaceae bacterium]|nr:AAA domain-containing protein [Polyangiaceae bacterium]
ALSPGPETAELIGFATDNVGGSIRVVELTLAAAPQSPAHVRHVAIVPNLVQIERQLDALHQIENEPEDGPLAPLRALIGMTHVAQLATAPAPDPRGDAEDFERLDEHQRECVVKALTTPHFSVIEGPPGSGKTTVITTIVRQALARGDRVLVVSPTHVAVDNVVEKLVATSPSAEDVLDVQTIPVRYAARTAKLSEKALEYWVGAKRQRRAKSIGARVQARLSERFPLAGPLFKRADPNNAGMGPLSSAVSSQEAVICGTPIGVLSYDAVKNAPPGSFGMLIVDEVSKMTLPEFLAIAVKARRWVAVGDPAQLPPYNDAEENGVTLDDVVPSVCELACSTATVLGRVKRAFRQEARFVVVCSEPSVAAAAIRAHLRSVFSTGLPSVGLVDSDPKCGIVVCTPTDAERACHALAKSSGGVRVLVEHGIDMLAGEFAGAETRVKDRDRAHARVFSEAFDAYHCGPWARRSGQRLASNGFDKRLQACMPSMAVLDVVVPKQSSLDEAIRSLAQAVSTRFAINTVSLYDWLTAIPTTDTDCSPLRDLTNLCSPELQAAIRPFVGTLKKQYRMHASLSRVPRQLFYFGEALFDGCAPTDRDCRVSLVQVDRPANAVETNQEEVRVICELLQNLGDADTAKHASTSVMVIAPYRAQEAALHAAIGQLRAAGALGGVDIEVCTLDRCQGREADYVLISLVRNRATAFLDAPNRWNVALTRAKQGLFIVGDIAKFAHEAARARNAAGRQQPEMSLLARVVEAYSTQIRAARTTDPHPNGDRQ